MIVASDVKVRHVEKAVRQLEDAYAALHDARLEGCTIEAKAKAAEERMNNWHYVFWLGEKDGEVAEEVMRQQARASWDSKAARDRLAEQQDRVQHLELYAAGRLGEMIRTWRAYAKGLKK